MVTKKIIASIYTAVCLLLVVIAVASNPKLSQEDKAQIESVIQRWQELSHAADINGGDVSQFPEVLVNTSDYPLDARHLKYIADILGPDAVPGAGFLTAMQAQHKNHGTFPARRL